MDKFRLTDNFLSGYKTRKAPFGFNGLGQLVYIRTYSRLKPDGQNENWWETVQRVVEGTFNMQKKWIEEHQLGWSAMKAQKSAQEMYDRIFSMKFLPPGRGLWAMGSNITEERGIYMALNNCFSGDTELLTDNGIVKFNDLEEGQQVKVLTQDNKFEPAIVRSFGEQELNKIVLKPSSARSNLKFTLEATPNHRWVLHNGEQTTSLKVGDKLDYAVFEYGKENKQYNTGYMHGLIFGDGTRHTYYPDRHFIKVCDGRADEYNSIAKTVAGYRGMTKGGADGYPVITIVTVNENWKSLPVQKTPDYYSGFINGWIAADSWDKPKKGNVCLDTQNMEAAEWVIKYAPYAGYLATGHSQLDSDTNFGKRKNSLNRISLTPLDRYLTVKSINKSKKAKVYCVTEPKTGTFTLAGGILTGNCAFVSTSTLKEDQAKPFCFLMDVSMVGVGCGFDVKGAGLVDIYEPKGEWKVEIQDTREDWVESLRYLIEAYFNGSKRPVYDYSKIRPAGLPIKGFGGVSSGPEPLKEMHEAISATLDRNIGKPLTITAIVDIMNLIGKCVVAGNVRRTAEIVFGDYNSDEYLDLKNYKVNPKRESFGWTSNNSIFCDLGMDYTKAAERTRANGEPGYAWLENMQGYSRMNNGKDNRDHRVVGGNPCLEQSLESYEVCNLVETFPNNHESLDDYLITLKYAYLYAKTVTLGQTHWSETNRVMLRNRRIGCSMSGIAQFISSKGLHALKSWCEEGYKAIERYDEVYSDWLAIPKSIKKTSIKPSGTVSLLAGATPGIHYPENSCYIRRMRISKHSDLVQPLKDAGYKLDPCFGSEDSTLVVEIPVKIGENIRTLKDVSIWEQVALAAFMQRYWADNQVSCTVTFKKEEGSQIKPLLDIYQYQLKGISFLPSLEGTTAYRQMPYESITDKKYQELADKLKPLRLRGIHGEEAEVEKFCSNDTCEIKITKK